MSRKSPLTTTINQVTREYVKEQKRLKADEEKVKRDKEKEAKRIQKENEIKIKENSISIANEITTKAEIDREKIHSLLKSINYNNKETINWRILKDYKKYNVDLKLDKLPIEPIEDNYNIGFSLLNYIIPYRKNKLEEQAKSQYFEDLNRWKQDCKNIEKNNAKRISVWENNKNNFEYEKTLRNNKIDKLKRQYEQGEKEGVEFYVNKILSQIKYTTYYNTKWELEYSTLNKMLIVEYTLPNKEKIPNLKEKKYVATKKEFKDILLKDVDINKIYEESLYQICLRINYDIYMSDIKSNIEGIVFNGYLTELNRSNGKEETNCILSLQTSKERFMEYNLANVDSKLCFKRMKGRAGAKICDLVPVAPICNISKYDKRFVESHEVGDKINGYNLASMHWKEFEHLIRELFEKEYAKEDVEVKITQSSKDGGVDAVIIDSDPIKGGKTVIQAKRYTNVVGVGYVRDLSGAVQHEGAMKGILVTTSDFGRDSYEFIKNKPLTLINGENLLYMLEKHGYEARIDLDEARLEIKEQHKS